MESKSTSVSNPIPIPQQNTSKSNSNTPKSSLGKTTATTTTTTSTSIKNNIVNNSKNNDNFKKPSPKIVPQQSSSVPNTSGVFKQPPTPPSNIKKSASSSFTSLFSQGNNRMRMSYSPSNTSTNSSLTSMGTSVGSISSSPSSSLSTSPGFLNKSTSNNSISSSPFTPIPSPRGLYKPNPLSTSGGSSDGDNTINNGSVGGLTSTPSQLLMNYSGSSSISPNSISTSPNILLKPSPSTSSNHIQPGLNTFLKPIPSPAAVYNSIPKTKTVGFSIPTTTTTTTTSSTTLKKDQRLIDSDEIMGGVDDDDDEDDIDFGAEDSSTDDEIQDADEEDYEKEEEYEDDIISPPSSFMNDDSGSRDSNTSSSNNSKNNFVNIESLNSQLIEKIVLDGWNDKIKPRNHQKETVNLILQDIFNIFQKNKEKQLDKEVFKIPKIKSEFSSNSFEDPNQLLSKTINNNMTTTTTTSNSSTKLDMDEHSTRNYLIQHAAGSGKSLTISSLVFNLYRLMQGGKNKYDLVLILNDRRHLDTQLGTIVSKFLKDNEMTSFHHPNTVAHLERVLNKGKTRVVITTMQKFTNLIDKSGKFDKISSKYKSIALISDEAHRSHGKAMSRNIHSILTGDTRQNSNITYFCFTCTPTARCLEMFGETKGNLKVPFHCYSLEKALQDKLVLSVVDNYTTVSILTKVTNNEQPQSQLQLQSQSQQLDEKKASYHLLKNAVNDKKILQEKACYIIKHFVKICETVNNSDFKCRAMLVTSNRNQILLYKTMLEQLIKQLPKEQKFDIVATFSPFVYRKKVKMDSDEKINGKYAKYFKKRDGISDIIKRDKKHNVQLIIVADKLQTGFDEPSLAVMYVDKTLKGANAVQTLGRLSRLSKGKKSCYVVDFCNSRKEISDSFSQYWRETQLKGATRKTVLEIKLNRLFNKFNDIEPLSKGRIPESVEYILKDDEKRKKERRNGSLTDDISTFVGLCNQLFWDNNTSPMNVRFLESVKFGVCQARSKSQLTSIRGLLRNIENKSTLLGSSTAPILNFDEGGNIQSGRVKKFSTSRPNLTSSENIISSFNKREENRAFELLKDNYYGSASNPMDLDADNLEFAKEMWSSNPDFKLQSSLLAPLTPEELDPNIKPEPHELDLNQASASAKLILDPNSNSIEEVIDVVVEFVSRNGTTFENFIHNQSLTKLFPFIDPLHPHHHSYKGKLDQARHELHQKEVQEQLHIKLEQHKQMLKDNNDVVMNDSNNNNIRSSLTSLNIQILDVPLPAPLPLIPKEAIVGKPHSAGHLDDCLLDDCILSFVHDLESKDIGVRVFAVQTLTTLAHKGIHKNNMHEIVSAINKILLNRQENLSLKMVALDLLGMVSVNDEQTINQIIENGVTQTGLKLISSAEEPLKAKSCKFFTTLSNDVSIVSAIIENHGVNHIINCLDSYDYYVTEHALKLLVSLSHEERTLKLIRSNIDTSIWARLEHHKINNINELCQQLRTLLSGTKRALSQFQPSVNSKRIRPTTILTLSN